MIAFEQTYLAAIEHQKAGHFDAAKAALLSLISSVDDLVMRGLVSLRLGTIHIDCREYNDAQKRLTEAYDIIIKHGPRTLRGEVAYELASTYDFLGKEELAQKLYVSAIRFARQWRDASLLARCYQNLSSMELSIHFVATERELLEHDDLHGIFDMAEQAALYLDEAEAAAERDERVAREERPSNVLLRARIALLRGDIYRAGLLCEEARQGFIQNNDWRVARALDLDSLINEVASKRAGPPNV